MACIRWAVEWLRCAALAAALAAVVVGLVDVLCRALGVG